MALQGPVLKFGQVDTHGPRLASITYTVEGSDTAAATDMSTGAINVYDLSFGVAAWTSLTALSVQTGNYPAYALDGIYFNMLRPIANTTAFHRAIAELWNASQFSSAYLEGIAGLTAPDIMPCTTFKASCDNTHYVSSNPGIFATAADAAHLQNAINSLYAAGLVTCVGSTATVNHLYQNSNGVNSSVTWKVGNCAGSAYSPNWWYRNSLGRHFFSDYIHLNAAKIGLVFTFKGNGGIGQAIVGVFDASAGAVLSDGVYVAGKATGICAGGVNNTACFGQKGYNTHPSYNITDAISGADTWDMYSYGYSSSQNTLFPMDAFNSEFGSSDTNPTNQHNALMDYWSNQGVYAKTSGAAATAGRHVSLIQLQTLSMLNVYYENTLWGTLVNSWSGYAGIPGYGPDTGPGLDYTMLNLGQTCYLADHNTAANPQTCTLNHQNGGTAVVGLGDFPSAPGGLFPGFSSNTVYDNDIWSNIYDSPLNTPPNGFQAPLKFMNWMTSSFKVQSFAGLTGTGSGWFDYQGAGPLNIVGGKIYTFNFLPNVYFSDHVRMTAYDYNYSLYALGVGTPLPGQITPFLGAMTGPAGLMASYINPLTPNTIAVYVNSSSAWNLLNLQVPVLAQHVLGPYFNAAAITGGSLTLDTATTPSAAIAGSANFTSGRPAAPNWLLSLPNLEQGTGPFVLRSTNELSGATVLLASNIYYRQFWKIYAFNSTNGVVKGNPYSLSVPFSEWSSNATLCVSGDHICQVPLDNGTNAVAGHGTWAVVNHAGHPITQGTVSCASGHCTATIATGTLPKGPNEVVITVPYTYLGLSRTLYMQYGFFIH